MTEINKNILSSELTKEKLINEGIKLFALHGINGVRTRQLAENAGVNQSAIPYHMGGKLGVYTAVIRKIATELARESNVEIFDSQFTQIRTQSQCDAQKAEMLIKLLMNGLSRALLAPEREYYSVLILREQLEPTENAEIIFNEFIAPFHVRLSDLVQFITHHDKQTAIIIAHALIGQILGFVIARKSVLKRLEKRELDPSLIEQISEQINILACRAIITQ
ncbi:CerR family C-terminal domain-containing protein [Providencia sp.]|uniref:CerR family C-terminal domain-containing protein n=1 Tax=Providencia sp. TaxID=589 RepID=UPI000E853C2D|nr:CerR family C-terminal domain-containing protein [Providencia sp.]HBO22007.1 DUF1956 domain-containing protein [Providencia sp.]